MWIFYFLFWVAVRANEEPLYRKKGDEVDLTPHSDGNPITSIRWKHGTGIAMQWFGDDISSYRQFKDRGSLNISTGVMTITGLTPNDSGIYTAEISGKETRRTELLVTSPVSKPILTVSCERTYCLFTCSGSITDAGPVTYWWTAGEKRWTSTKELRITQEEEEQWFICTLENPVSSISSERVSNPFKESNRTLMHILIPVVVVILVVCIIVVIYFRHKKRKEMASETLTIQNRPTQGTSTAPSETSDETAPHLQSLLSEHKPQWQYAGERHGQWVDFGQTVMSPPRKCSTTIKDIEKRYEEMSPTVNGSHDELDVAGASNVQNDQSPLEHEGPSRGSKQMIDSSNKCSATNDDNESQHQPTSSETLTVNGSPSEQDANNLQSRLGGQSPLESDGRKHGGINHLKRKMESPDDAVTSNAIERQYQQNRDSCISFTVNTSPYELDLNKKILTNLETNSLCKIRRVLVLPES